MNKVRVGSYSGEALQLTGSGHGTTLVALQAARLAQSCLSCRTVHYFVLALPRRAVQGF
jgi:hypothetical protein